MRSTHSEHHHNEMKMLAWILHETQRKSNHILFISIVFFLLSLLCCRDKVDKSRRTSGFLSAFGDYYATNYDCNGNDDGSIEFGRRIVLANSKPRFSSSKLVYSPSATTATETTSNYQHGHQQEQLQELRQRQEVFIKIYTGLYSYTSSDNTESLSNRLKHYIMSTTSSSSSSSSHSNTNYYYSPRRRKENTFQNAERSSNPENKNTSMMNKIQLKVQYIPMNIDKQLEFLHLHGHECYNNNNHIENDIHDQNNNDLNPILSLYKQLISKEYTKPLAQELWKFCILNHDLSLMNTNNNNSSTTEQQEASGEREKVSAVGYIDIDSPLLDTLENILFSKNTRDANSDNDNMIEVVLKNHAVIATSLRSAYDSKSNTIHGSFLLLSTAKTNDSGRHSSSSTELQQQQLLQQMMTYMLSNVDEMIHNPLFIGQRLYDLIQQASRKYIHSPIESRTTTSRIGNYDDHESWVLLQQKCYSNPFHTIVMEQKSKREKMVINNHEKSGTILWNDDDGINHINNQNNGDDDDDDYDEKMINSVVEKSDITPVHSIIHCPLDQQYCCDVIHPSTGKAIMMTRHILLPYQLFPPANLKYGLDLITNNNSTTTLSSPSITKNLALIEEDKPFITSINVRSTNLQIKEYPNFFHQVYEKDCLPTARGCELCMSKSIFNAGTCAGCSRFCGCFCDMLCRTHVEEKVVSKILTYSLPRYRKDPTRLIPRIVHQTWYEPITKDKYPNFSRLVESWKQQHGWEYRFYNDDEAAEFISMHFPREVRQAYDDLLPGAFKADLFRYCVLFVYGGVYADVDVMLTSKLEMAIDEDIGFMIPQDSKPGEESGHVMCLWNGLIASAPGHPILSKVIETVVNNIRNRFTGIDVMNTMCPDVHFSVSHKFSVLFTTGPCILGATINKMLQRHPQTSFEVGDFYLPSIDLVSGTVLGRVVILEGNKADMGAFRFTYKEKNLMIATTDMPDFDDRETNQKNVPVNHYSNIKKKGHIYGLTGLYKNNKIANENIEISLSGGQ